MTGDVTELLCLRVAPLIARFSVGFRVSVVSEYTTLELRVWLLLL